MFDPKSILVAITDDIEEAEQLVLSAVRSNSKVQDQQSKLATTKPDVSISTATSYISKLSDASVCSIAVGNYTKTWIPYSNYTKEAKRRGLSCGVSGISSAQIASKNTTQSTHLKPQPQTQNCKPQFKIPAPKPPLHQHNSSFTIANCQLQTTAPESTIPSWNSKQLP